MPYAHNNRISQDLIDGGIEITQEQYQQALAGMLAGLEVTIDDGFKVAPKPEPVEPPKPAPTLDDLKAAKVAALSISCKAAIVAGFDSSALGSVHHYPSKDTDQMNLSSSVLASILPGNPADWTTPFWCADGDTWAFVPHTATQIQQVGRDAKAAILTLMAKNAQLAAQAMAATDPAELDAIAW